MGFPSRGTRAITVRGERYVWHLSDNHIEGRERHISIRSEPVPGAMLFLDPYAWELEIRPANVALGIEFALDHGWSPRQPGGPMYLAFAHGGFFELPAGKRFAHELRSS